MRELLNHIKPNWKTGEQVIILEANVVKMDIHCMMEKEELGE